MSAFVDFASAVSADFQAWFQRDTDEFRESFEELLAELFAFRG